MDDAPDTQAGGMATRWRLLLLGAAILFVALAAGAFFFVAAQRDARDATPLTREQQSAHFGDLARGGQISGDQALELARLIQEDAFGAVTVAAPAAPSETAFAGAPVVSPADAMAAARASFADAAATLLQDPDARVRRAVLLAGRADRRRQALDAMRTIAREGGAAAAPLWRASGAMMLAANDERAMQALENARALNPQDKALWRMLSFSYALEKRPRDAAGAAFVAAGLDAAAEGKWGDAVTRLDRALPLVSDAQTRSFVHGQLGDAEAARGAWRGAEARYEAALGLHAAQKNIAGISMDSSKLARAQLKQGDARRACATLEAARRQGASVTDEERLAACGAMRATPPG